MRTKIGRIECPIVRNQFQTTPKNDLEESFAKHLQARIRAPQFRSKEILEDQENVESIELCTVTPEVKCGHCVRYSDPGHIQCRCGTFLPRSQEDSKALEQEA